MNGNFQPKKVTFFNASFIYIYFKNIAVSNFPSFSESMSELFYDEKLSPVSVTIAGPKKNIKSWEKSIKQTFDETSWITTWFDTEAKDQTISGFFITTSGVSLVSLISDNFKCKLFDTTVARICFMGELISPLKKSSFEEEFNQVDQQIDKALTLCGLEQKHLLSQSFFIKTENQLPITKQLLEKRHLGYGLTHPAHSLVCNNQHQGSIVFDGMAIKPINGDNSKFNEEILKPKELGISVLHFAFQNSSYTQMFYSLPTINLNNSNFEINISELLNTISEWLNNNGLHWNRMYEGILFFSNETILKTFKKLCQDLKIPMSPLLFILREEQNTSALIELEMVFINE